MATTETVKVFIENRDIPWEEVDNGVKRKIMSYDDRLMVVKVQFENDRLSETGAIKDYNQAIAACVKHQDNGTRELLEGILKDEEEHIDWLEAQLDQIEQMGQQNYMAMQMDSE